MSLSLVLPLELVRWPTEAFSGNRPAPWVLCMVLCSHWSCVHPGAENSVLHPLETKSLMV